MDGWVGCFMVDCGFAVWFCWLGAFSGCVICLVV